MSNFKQSVLLSVTLLALIAQASPTMAFRLPLGALATNKRLGDSGSDPKGAYNLSYVPVLLDLAKVMGRFQPSSGYYIQNEPLSNQPGIDLRTLFLNQSGLLQLPEGLVQPADGRPPTLKSGPNLAVPSVNKSQGGGPDLQAVQLKIPVLPSSSDPAPVSNPPAQVGSADNITMSAPDNELNGSSAPVISIDFNNLSHALTNARTPDAEANQTAFVSPRLKSSFSNDLSVNTETQNPCSAFLLWTLRSGTTDGAAPPDQSSGVARPPFCGTFVVCMPGTRFKSMSSRRLVLAEGRLLAGNADQPLSFSTNLADIELQAGASAIIDLSKSSVLRIYCLGPRESGHVLVNYKPANAKPQKFELMEGDELILSGVDLTASDLSKETASIKLPHSPVLRTRFEVGLLVNKDPLLDDRQAELTDAQRSCLAQLRQRLSDNRQVSK